MINIGTILGELVLNDRYTGTLGAATVATDKFEAKTKTAFGSAGAAARGYETRVLAAGAATGVFAGQLGGELAGVLVGVVKDIVATTGKIVDLSDKTRLSTTTIQQMMAV